MGESMMDSGRCVHQFLASRAMMLSSALLALTALATPSFAQNAASGSQQYEVPKQAPPGPPCPDRKPDMWLGVDANNCIYERPCPNGGYAPNCAGQASSGTGAESKLDRNPSNPQNGAANANTPYRPPQGWAKSYPFSVNPPGNGQTAGTDQPNNQGNPAPYQPPNGWAKSYPFIVKPPAQPQSPPANGGTAQ